MQMTSDKINLNLKIKTLFLILGFGLWYSALKLRDVGIRKTCHPDPLQCGIENVWSIDAWSIPLQYGWADAASFWTQDFCGILFFFAPLYFALKMKLYLKAASNLILALTVTAFNGFFTEATRIYASRPRPFVYLNPTEMGTTTGNYTSFYSGHTSFAFAASIGLAIILSDLKISSRTLLLLTTLSLLSAFSTGILRVLGGRHFTTDVLAGGIAGSIVAFVICSRQLSAVKLNPELP